MEISREESEYRWLEAAESYQQELRTKPEILSSAAEYYQRIGYCYNLASRQAPGFESFKRLRLMAVDAYAKAAGLFKNDRAKSLECLALAEHTRSWVNSSPLERKKTLEKCLRLGKCALRISKSFGASQVYGDVCNLMALCIWDLHHLILTSAGKKRIIREGFNYAMDAVSTFSKLKRKDDLILALSMSSLLSENLLDDHQAEKSLSGFCQKYAGEAIKLSSEVDNPYSKAMAYWAEANCKIYLEEKLEERGSLLCPEEMLKQASKVHDNYLKGNAYHVLAYAIYADVLEELNPSTKKRRYDEIIKYSEKAVYHLQLVGQDACIAVTHLFSSESYVFLSKEFAVTTAEKLTTLKKAIKAGEKGLAFAIRSGSPYALQVNLHALSRAYYHNSFLEQGKESRVRLLKRALEYRRKEIRSTKKSFPSNYWYTGVGMVYAAQIEAELAKLEKNDQRKTILFEEAVAFMDKGISQCKKTLEFTEVPAAIVRIAEYEDALGGMLEECYTLTRKKENLTKANEIYCDAVKNFEKINLPSRTAECFWKIAKNQDSLGDFREASSSFEKASCEFKNATAKVPSFEDFYLGYAVYVKAWGEIEKAKLEHCSQNYVVAKQHYEEAATLLQKSKTWTYLSSNFQAWSLLEQAEEMSKEGNCQESITSFKGAVKSFRESKQLLSANIARIEKTDERELTMTLIDVSDTREEWSNGRIAVEEAKILDMTGNHAGSSERYEKAAAIFHSLLKSKSEQIGNEAKPLFYLCRAWKEMTMAEARVSPEMYDEAAKLFRLANEYAPNETASLLALAHSSFCKALGAGTRFEITRNATMYIAAKQHMNSAASYYLKAGLEAFSEYAKATQRLLDAYVYTDNAKKETDPEKEAKYYVMAEKVLQLSVESYARAKYSEKTIQVQRLLEKVKEEKELALSLSEIIHAPAITSSAAGFTTLSLTEERAVGLERFEHADIQAKVIKHETKVRVGEYVSLEVQIVNVGKEPVLLTKIEGMVPPSFQLVGKPDYSSFDGGNLTFKGRQLAPLKTEQTKILLKALSRGTFELKMSITCVDEIGRLLINNPDALTVEVAETILAGRVPTGYSYLDDLLLGGIPENYAVALSSPSTDERERLLDAFLNGRARSGQDTFYVTSDIGRAKVLAEKSWSGFFVLVCNPRADAIESASNVFKLPNAENLTEISISLIKAFRNLDKSNGKLRILCLDILSDVLLQHHAVVTRKWLSELLPDLRSRGFTTLAVLNPKMHPQEEVQAAVDQFDGEIQIYEREADSRTQQFLRIKRLYGQRYLESEIPIPKTVH